MAAQKIPLMPEAYTKYVKKADSLSAAKNYKSAGANYTLAFNQNGGKGFLEDRYRAGRAWSMAKVPDSAFYELFRITEKVFFKDTARVLNDNTLKLLHTDARWEKLLQSMVLNTGNPHPNLGFEIRRFRDNFPFPWFEWGTKDYMFQLDSIQKHSGRYSVLIEPREELKGPESFGCIAVPIINDYAGKEIEVRAYLKFENATSPIGLLLRIDDSTSKNTLKFDNMVEKGIKGTRDWAQYSVKLPFPPNGAIIYIGAILSGTGKLWADDFEVLIDGKDYYTMKRKKR
jgi:hypothetical protein